MFGSPATRVDPETLYPSNPTEFAQLRNAELGLSHVGTELIYIIQKLLLGSKDRFDREELAQVRLRLNELPMQNYICIDVVFVFYYIYNKV